MITESAVGRRRVLAEIKFVQLDLKIDLLHERHFALNYVFQPLLAETTLARPENNNRMQVQFTIKYFNVMIYKPVHQSVRLKHVVHIDRKILWI